LKGYLCPFEVDEGKMREKVEQGKKKRGNSREIMWFLAGDKET
jgi:hypothetical protein